MAVKVTRSFGKTPAWMRDEPIPSRHRKVPLVTELQRRRPRDGRYGSFAEHLRDAGILATRLSTLIA